MKIVLVTGGFDPIHSGHIKYFEKAKELGDILVVGINSDEWLTRKKGRPFMSWKERSEIVKSLKSVSHVLHFDDADDSAKDAIRKTRLMWPSSKIIFANGGDRTKDNIPEMEFVDNNLEFVFGVGGENKINSSSWILQEWKQPKTERPWGYYRVLYEDLGTKVKELTVNPGMSLSMQRHFYRSEYWHVVEGEALLMKPCDKSFDTQKITRLYKHDSVLIEKFGWHQLCNISTNVLKIVEIQYGDQCEEKDIERHDY